MHNKSQSRHKWFILILSLATGAIVASLQMSCMPPLFKEISEDIGLNLVQIGTIWGMANMAGMFFSLIGGFFSDRFGIKPVMVIFCIMAGITGSLRGLSEGFYILSLTVFLNGIARLMVQLNLHNAIGASFRGKNLGIAMGISSMGLGLGLALGPIFSATLLSSLLGGWRNVLHVYGILAVIMGIAWLLFAKEPGKAKIRKEHSGRMSIHTALSKLIHIKEIWLIAVTFIFRYGCLLGFTGYLPLYLRGQGWSPANADGTLSAFFVVSTLCVVPLSFLSDRIGSRKKILVAALVATAVSFCLIPFVHGVYVILLTLLAGIFMDGFMAISITMLLEIKGIAPEYSGTALGIVFTAGPLGSAFSPPLGNSLAQFSPGMPILFWGVLSVIALFAMIPVKENTAPAV